MIVNIADLRRAAKGRLPRAVFDYIDGGADDEVTLRGNERAFEQITLRPRRAVATPQCDLRTTVLGLLPIGASRNGSSSCWPACSIRAAKSSRPRRRGAAGTAYTLSTLSGCRLEDVRAATTGLAWYPLYLCGGHDVARAGIARAKAAGFSVLVVTIDTPTAGLREKDIRNDVRQLASRNPLTMLPYLPQILARPRWLAGFLADGGLMKLPNVMLASGPMPCVDVVAALTETSEPNDSERMFCCDRDRRKHLVTLEQEVIVEGAMSMRPVSERCPFFASAGSNAVCRLKRRSSGSPEFSGAMCWTMKRAGRSVGSWPTSGSSVSSPPADVPITMILRPLDRIRAPLPFRCDILSFAR
jgi:FMN-dependent dehydrogenase